MEEIGDCRLTTEGSPSQASVVNRQSESLLLGTRLDSGGNWTSRGPVGDRPPHGLDGSVWPGVADPRLQFNLGLTYMLLGGAELLHVVRALQGLHLSRSLHSHADLLHDVRIGKRRNITGVQRI